MPNDYKRKSPEQDLQEWYTLFLTGLGVLYCASAGGMRTGIATAKKMKRAGYRKGFPDMAILEPRGVYHGLFFELKVGTNNASAGQLTWMAELRARGYCSLIVPRGLDYQKAQFFLEEMTRQYLALGPEEFLEI